MIIDKFSQQFRVRIGATNLTIHLFLVSVTRNVNSMGIAVKISMIFVLVSVRYGKEILELL